MSAIMTPYLSFRDQAAEALGFYRGIFGGEVETTTFGEGGLVQDPAEADKVMHGRLTSDAGFVLMASDTPASMGVPSGSAITLSLSGDDEGVLGGWWDALTADGTIVLPLEVAPWGDRFGMCTDRYGIDWMVSISPAPTAA
ncbi:VOC family protein [Clavibacter capsici]|uniref:VOC family protein n=1 Tax=Clavibacter capsici TaxID=1874630 RepID=A0A0M5JP58_9MICO|nr:VOC family protein [Clavibacter capsici]ALD13927.1 3-demethylubiquinone-9 3-methyltransferase [Clavibacter capsici]QIS43211.1 VOC family protein [Clavibacter capsici]QIS46162.1 VOC family protein [Clavibacter capsici]